MAADETAAAGRSRPKVYAVERPARLRAVVTYDPRGQQLIAPEENLRAVEFLYPLAHFHHSGAPLGLGHTVNFGEELWDGSGLDHGFLSFPYVEAPGFESFDCRDGRTNLAWLIPITARERDYKKENGAEALETLFEEHSLDCLNPSRASLV